MDMHSRSNLTALLLYLAVKHTQCNQVAVTYKQMAEYVIVFESIHFVYLVIRKFSKFSSPEFGNIYMEVC